MNKPEIAVVLINWRRPDEVAATVGSLSGQTYRGLRVYVVNNGDPQPLRASLQGSSGIPVSIIEAGRNSGFSGACNLAFARARSEGVPFLWFLNTDTLVPTDGVAALVDDALAHPEAGLFSPIITHDGAGGSVWVAGGRFDADEASFDWFQSRTDALECMRATPAKLMLPGTALLVRTQDFERIGPMDEKLFAYHEDVDFSIRAEQCGIGRRLVPDVELTHLHAPGSKPAPYVGYYTTRNSILLSKKHFRPRVVMRRLYWEFLRLRKESKGAGAGDEALRLDQLGLWHGVLGVGGELTAASRVPPLFEKMLSA